MNKTIRKLLLLPPENSNHKGPPHPIPQAPPRPRKDIQIPLEDLSTMAQAVAKSGMFGVKDESQALSLMLLCQAEGLHPVLALRRYHIIEGKPSMRADALQGEFEQAGAILWHERTEMECSATFFREKSRADANGRIRAKQRYAALKAGEPVADMSEIGEITIIRTIEDAMEKKVAMSWKDQKWQVKHNWRQSPRQMLHARCLSEGVRAIAPGLIAGIYAEDEGSDFPDDGSVTVETSPAERMSEAQRRVEEATKNRLADRAPEVIEKVTEENFNDFKCHIGQANGDMLGKKISEIHPKILNWLQAHYGEGEGTRWGNPPSEKDAQLKSAVDLALSKLAE